MRLRSTVSLLCVLAMIVSLFAACAGNSGSNSNEKTEGSSTGNSEASTAGNVSNGPDFSKKVDLTIASLVSSLHEDGSELEQYIYDKFNVNIKWLPLDWGNWGEQTKVMIASGDMPDAMHVDFDPTLYKQWVRQDLLKPLPDLAGFPNLKMAYDKAEVSKYLPIDGKPYIWLLYGNINLVNDLGSNGYVYRRDYARKIGYDYGPDQELTLEEFTKFLKDIIEKDPGGVGKGKMNGVAGLFGAIPLSFIEMYNPDWGTYKKVDGSWVWGPSMPETLDGIKLAKQLYDDGVIWKDFYSAKGGEAQEMFTAGTLEVFYTNAMISALNGLCTNLSDNNPGVGKEDLIGLLNVKSPDGKYSNMKSVEYWSGYIYSTNMSDEAMERLFYMMDWMRTEEGLYTAEGFGIPGRDWEMKDGQLNVLWPKDENGKYTRPPYKMLGSISKLTKIEGDLDFNPNNPLIDNFIKDMYSNYVKRQAEAGVSHLQDRGYAISFFSAPNKDKYGSFYEDTKNEIIKLVVGSKDLTNDWNNYLAKMKPKVQPVLDELNASLK